MEGFTVPARPWTEADVKFLVANAGLLNEETRAELGLSVPVADENFRADVAATPAVETEVIPEVEETPIEEEVADVVIEATTEAVDNTTTDNQ